MFQFYHSKKIFGTLVQIFTLRSSFEINDSEQERQVERFSNLMQGLILKLGQVFKQKTTLFIAVMIMVR